MTVPFTWSAPHAWLHDLHAKDKLFARIVETLPRQSRFVRFRLHMPGHVPQEFTSLIKAKRAAEACLPTELSNSGCTKA